MLPLVGLSTGEREKRLIQETVRLNIHPGCGESRWLGRGTVAGGAGRGINVYLQVRQLSESLFTFWMGTFVWPIACVDSEKANVTQLLLFLKVRTNPKSSTV